MSENISVVSPNCVSSPPLSKPEANFLEVTQSFFKHLDNFEDIVQCRGDVFSQKKEKHQQFIDYQIKKMEKEEEYYVKKTVELNQKIAKCNSKLVDLEKDTMQMKLKCNDEKYKNKTLKEKINQLQQALNKFNDTSELYLKAINKYKDFLNISIDADNRDPKIVNITFLKWKKFHEKPSLRIEILNNNKFKILKYEYLQENSKIIDEIISTQDLMLHLYKLQKSLNQDS